MKWGVRRYQNADGSLTSAGRKHYGYNKEKGNSTFYKIGEINATQAINRADKKASKYKEKFKKTGKEKYRIKAEDARKAAKLIDGILNDNKKLEQYGKEVLDKRIAYTIISGVLSSGVGIIPAIVVNASSTIGDINRYNKNMKQFS